jgi:hypothetical protein
MLASLCLREAGLPVCSDGGSDMDVGRLRWSPMPARRTIGDGNQKSGLCRQTST